MYCVFVILRMNSSSFANDFATKAIEYLEQVKQSQIALQRKCILINAVVCWYCKSMCSTGNTAAQRGWMYCDCELCECHPFCSEICYRQLHDLPWTLHAPYKLLKDI